MILILIFIIGLVMGSFYYVVGTRLLNNESIVAPRSHCDYCKHILKFYDLIPILSFITLKGKCRYCGRKLSLKYLVYEILTAVLFSVSYLKFGLSYDFFIMLIISSLVVLIFITDFQEMIILDSPLIIAIASTFALNLYFKGSIHAFFSLLHGLIIFIFLLAVRSLGNAIFKKESLGGGDIKLGFVMGVILNYRFALIAIVLSTFLAFPYALGAVLLNKDRAVAFGPFLVSAMFIVYLFMEKFNNIFSLFGI